MKKKKVRMNRPFYYNFEMFITEEEFRRIKTLVGLDVPIREAMNKYFTEFEGHKTNG